jgi:hypothetical protein
MSEIDEATMSDPERRETGENYVRYAWIALLLYFVLWVPGFIVNMVFLSRAMGEERATGTRPDGKGCLMALLIAGLVVPGIGACILMIMSMDAIN